MKGGAVVVAREAVMAVEAPDQILSPDRPNLSLLRPNPNPNPNPKPSQSPMARQDQQSLQTQATIRQPPKRFRPASPEPD